MFHLKDYAIDGSDVGFCVRGAPLGEGELDLESVLDAIMARGPTLPLFLENWTPATGDREVDVANDLHWLRRSLSNARRLLSGRPTDRASDPR